MNSGRRRRARSSDEYRAEEVGLAPFEQVARMVIGRRIELGITQEQLADRMGTTASTISRIESGQHVTSVTTLEPLADALEVRLLVGFETELVNASWSPSSANHPKDRSHNAQPPRAWPGPDHSARRRLRIGCPQRRKDRSKADLDERPRILEEPWRRLWRPFQRFGGHKR